MENSNLNANQQKNQLPEADSLPDGFVDSSSAKPLAPGAPGPEQEVTSKEEKLVKSDSLAEVVVNDGTSTSQDKSLEIMGNQNDQAVTMAGSADAGASSGERHIEEKSAVVKGIDSHPKEAPIVEASVVKRKAVKRTFKSEKEFLEFTLKYQQVLAERDSAIAVRDKLESLCRELQRQNKMLMDECKRVSNEGQDLRLDLSNKFQDAIKEVSSKLELQKDDCLTQLKENDMLKTKLKQFADQYSLSEQQHAQKLKQKTLELQLADLKLQQQEEKLKQEQSQMKLYAEQVAQLLATEKNLRLQLTADGEKFQQFQEALLKSNEVFETFKQEIEKMSKSMKDLKKENTFLKSKCDKTDVTLIEFANERERLKKQLEKTRNQKEKLESLCRSLQAERKANSVKANSSDSVQV
ncbi:beta-taxilin isoform X1 [Olea europaea subsp. europaea]|uniref:Beta-taxilin isoform X1 n=1 Tax=Olea europaea subsp. europaea TaxID=158383 RepID=A0A8S0PL72_OLEEU|nr:beta-taxilin isoform X1 [Olea europaea subsp. europaea]